MIAPAGLVFNNFVVGAVIVATLYFAREILVPIALAVLLSFMLAPLELKRNSNRSANGEPDSVRV